MSPKHDTIAFMDDNTTKRILGFPDEFWIAFVIMIGFFLKIIFDISTGYTFQARNLGMWTYLEPGQAHEGTLGVIQYLFENHRLPDFDPRTVNRPRSFIFYAPSFSIFSIVQPAGRSEHACIRCSVLMRFL